MIRHPGTGHQILFIEVPDGKTVKNRIHFDLCPVDGTRDEELARLLEHRDPGRRPPWAARRRAPAG